MADQGCVWLLTITITITVIIVIIIIIHVCLLLCSDNIGREVISRFSTALQTNSTFYTDANGREILQRM